MTAPIDHDDRLERLHRLANNMDSLFRIPGTRIRVGLDSIVGLIPGLGDTLALLPAGYIVASAAQMGAPRRTLMRMGFNVGVDWLIGAIPLVGDIFDVGWKCNRRNVALLRKHLEREGIVGPDVPVKEVEGRLSSHHPTLLGDTRPRTMPSGKSRSA